MPRKNPSHRKSKKRMKAGRKALALKAGYSRRTAKKIAKRAVYRGDSRKFGPTRLDKYRNPAPPAGKALVFQSKAAAQKYAKRNGLKGFSIRKAK